MKIVMTCLLFLSLHWYAYAQNDCYEDGKAKVARDNMDEGDDGLTCANAAKFYVMLCQYKTEPLRAEQGQRLRKQLKAIKKAYNDYGVYCKDIGRINEIVPISPANIVSDDSEKAVTDEMLLDAVKAALGSDGNGSGRSSGSCNTAALSKFGTNINWSSSSAESAATRYEGYRCHCENGTLQDGFTDASFDPKPLDTDKALKQIGRLRDRYYEVKSFGDPDLSPLPRKCLDNNGSAQSSKRYNYSRVGDALVDDQISNDLTAFTNQLANISDNPKIKRLSEEMNAVQQKYDDVEVGVHRFGSALGIPVDQETRNMMNFYQNAEMAVAIGKVIFGKEPSLEERLSASQLAVREHMLDISRNLRVIYDEVAAVEPYLSQGESYLKTLESRKQKISSYNYLTSKERYYYLWYLNFNGFPDLQDYNAEKSRVEQYTVNQLLGKIASLQQNKNMSDIPHIGNKDVAFARATNQLVLNEMSYYKSQGHAEKAEALKGELTFNVPVGQTISLIVESFNQREFYATTQYAQIVQDYFQNEKVMHLYYENIPGLPKQYTWASDDEMDRGEVSILMLLGIIAAVETEQFSQAQNGLAVLTEFHNNTMAWNNEKSSGGRRKRAKQTAVKNVLAMQLTKSHLALNTAKGYLNLALKNYQSAIENINEASQYLTVTSGTVSGIPVGLFHKLKIRAYLGLQDFNAAKKVFRDWNSAHSNVNAIYYTGDGAIQYMEETDRDYYNALIRYNKKDFRGALLALKLMGMKSQNTELRVYYLKESIHRALGQSEEAEIAREKYINLLSN